MTTFMFWCERPYRPRRIDETRVRRKSRTVTIRYNGSFGRSAVKTVLVLVLLAAMRSIIG